MEFFPMSEIKLPQLVDIIDALKLETLFPRYHKPVDVGEARMSNSIRRCGLYPCRDDSDFRIMTEDYNLGPDAYLIVKPAGNLILLVNDDEDDRNYRALIGFIYAVPKVSMKPGVITYDLDLTIHVSGRYAGNTAYVEIISGLAIYNFCKNISFLAEKEGDENNVLITSISIDIHNRTQTRFADNFLFFLQDITAEMISSEKWVKSCQDAFILLTSQVDFPRHE